MHHIKTTNDTPFVSALEDFTHGMAQLDDIGSCVSEIGLQEMGEDPKIVIWELGSGIYNLYPIRCSVKRVEQRAREAGQLPERIQREDSAEWIRVIRRDVALSTSVTVYYKTPEYLKQSRL